MLNTFLGSAFFYYCINSLLLKKRIGELVAEDGKITAYTLDSNRLFVYDGKETMYIFSWNNGVVTWDIHDYEFTSPPDGFEVENGKLTANVECGKVYELKVK